MQGKVDDSMLGAPVYSVSWVLLPFTLLTDTRERELLHSPTPDLAPHLSSNPVGRVTIIALQQLAWHGMAYPARSKPVKPLLPTIFHLPSSACPADIHMRISDR